MVGHLVFLRNHFILSHFISASLSLNPCPHLLLPLCCILAILVRRKCWLTVDFIFILVMNSDIECFLVYSLVKCLFIFCPCFYWIVFFSIGFWEYQILVSVRWLLFNNFWRTSGEGEGEPGEKGGGAGESRGQSMKCLWMETNVTARLPHWTSCAESVASFWPGHNQHEGFRFYQAQLFSFHESLVPCLRTTSRLTENPKHLLQSSFLKTFFKSGRRGAHL